MSVDEWAAPQRRGLLRFHIAGFVNNVKRRGDGGVQKLAGEWAAEMDAWAHAPRG